MINEFIAAVTENFFVLIIVIALVMIVLAITRMVIKVKTSSSAARLAEIGVDSKKLDMVTKKAYLDSLRDASIVLSDDERSFLDSIRTDSAVLARKNVARRHEIEERTRRVELGSDLAQLSHTLNRVKRYERSLFKNL